MPRIRKPTRALAALLIALPALAAETPAPDPLRLLDTALNPQVSFKGRMMVTHWFGKQTSAEEVEVYHAPPNLYRREFLTPDGTVQRVQVSDGETEENLLLKHHKIVSGDAARSYEKLMRPEREMGLLLKNYGLAVTRPDEVAGRKAWILEMKPRVAGKPWQRLWIDQKSGIILENKRFLPKRRYAVLSRYSKVEIEKDLDPSLFALSLSSTATQGAAHGLEPDFLTIDELKKASGKNPHFPPELPEGFVFESADYFPWGKDVILHARYTDGLAVVSLFQTEKPVRLPKDGTTAVAPPSKEGPSSVRLSLVGKVLNWKRGKQYYTLMGDVSVELLQTISAKLK